MQRPLCSGTFHEHQVECGGAAGRGGQDRAGQRSGAGAGVDDDPTLGSTGVVPPRVERGSHDGTEERADLGRGDERAVPPSGPPAGLVEPARRVVEGVLDEVGDGDVRPDQGPTALKNSVASLPRLVAMSDTPKAKVATMVSPMAAWRAKGTVIGVRSPSGTSFIHISRATLA